VHLLEASEIMDALFWKQAHGDRDALLAGIDDPATRRFVEINYGPWDRLDGGAPFVAGVGPRPPGANFYPADMTKEEFEAADLPGKDGLYTLVRRNEAGELVVVPYHEEYAEELGRAAELLREAAKVATDEGFRNYLQLRADALLSGDYQPSDMAWMDMKTSPIDVVIGPIESYEDGLFGTKTAFEAFVLVKDVEWSERLAKFAQHLPALQRGLPVEAAVQGRVAGLGRRPQRLRRHLLRRRRQRRRQDHRHQPAQRRAGAAGQGLAPAAAEERDARQVRRHPAAAGR
jgi:hypothetical protein